MSYEYRVFMVHQANKSTFLHRSPNRCETGWLSRWRGRVANSIAAP